MSNIDKQALNQEKIEWLNKLADMEYCKSNPGHWLMSLKDTNMLAKLALRSVALLDELEAAERQSAVRLEALNNRVSEINTMRYRIKTLNGTVDIVDGQRDLWMERCKEAEVKLEAAEKRIAELEMRTMALRG